jgi:glycerophosphoryl diester phosphodiesterase
MKIIGHRGAKGLAPENTLHAFTKALEHHVDEIELDVRVTKDGLTALVHDPYVTDHAGNQVDVLTTSFAELQRHKPDLVGLTEAIELVNRRVPIVIEMKPAVESTQTIAILTQFLHRGWQPRDFFIASFDQAILVEMHQALPDIPMVVNETWSGVKAVHRARQVHTRRLGMRSWWLWIGFLAPMHHRGWQIAAYTINDPAKVRSWRKYLYGIYTDRPDLFDHSK